MTEIDTGDTVKHRPTGETWIVACVQGDDLSWLGWPEGFARLSDCELVQKATPEERQELLERMAENYNTGDHRVAYARRRLRPAPFFERPGVVRATEITAAAEDGRLLGVVERVREIASGNVKGALECQ